MMFDPKRKCPVLGIDINIGRPEEAADYITSERNNLKGSYVCFSNVHTTVMAYRNEEYGKALKGAGFVFPDGKPIASEQKKKGYADAQRIAGPDFMKEMFQRSRGSSMSHFFYGSTPQTLERLKENLQKDYPGIDIRGMYSPPFRELSGEETACDIERINESGADLVWIGLGAPKQELFMYRAKGRVNALMLGVGAGFAFHAGTKKRAPLWMQRAGLEWLFRLLSDPKRLLGRYLVTNTQFLWYTKIRGR